MLIAEEAKFDAQGTFSSSPLYGEFQTALDDCKSKAKFRQFVRLVAADLRASTISVLAGLSRATVNRYVQALRERPAMARVTSMASRASGARPRHDS